MRTLFIIIYLLIFSSVLFGQTKQDQINASKKIDSLFSKYNENTPGVAVGVMKNGEFIFKKEYGVSNLEYNLPISESSVFHIASVSKQFTAFAIYLLENQQLLSLEDDIRKYIPEMPQYAHVIKVKHLLAHTSGLREQFALLTLAGWDMTDHITTEHILKLAFAQKELNFEPGSQFAYCNTGYTLMAVIVERISGMTFNEFCSKNIFEPLDMSTTQFYDDSRKVVKNRAYSYEIKESTYVKKKLNYSMVGATGLFTTVDDLGKWANNFENPIVGTEELIRNFNAISKLDNGERAIWRLIERDTLYYAKGQIVRDYKGVKVYKHGGHDAGYRTFLARFPDENLTVITLSNDEHYEIFARGMEIAELYLEDKLEQEPPFINEVNGAITSEEFTPNDLEKYVGTYFSKELDTHYYVVKKDNDLIIQHQRLKDMSLTSIDKDKFEGTNYYWYFELDFVQAKGEISGFDISNFGVKNVRFNKVDD